MHDYALLEFTGDLLVTSKHIELRERTRILSFWSVCLNAKFIYKSMLFRRET